jgi:hypothetical protein
MQDHFHKLEFDATTESALVQHAQCLETVWPHLAQLKSSRRCFSCFMCVPEKVFQCGHAICNTCVRRFGHNVTGSRHSFRMLQCILCGFYQTQKKTIFHLLPPTAGLRVLCLDGGGVRGVIPLVFLQHLENDLKPLGCDLWDMFDYVGGTSAGELMTLSPCCVLKLINRLGGLIAIGIFLMHWSPTECLERFENLATEIFKSDYEGSKLSWSQSLHRLLRVYVQDHRYSLSPVERAFVSTIGPTEKMFNPLQTDTKVAVMSTSVKANTPCVISNYNGGPRPDDNSKSSGLHADCLQLKTEDYSHIRAAKHCHDISIGDA